MGPRTTTKGIVNMGQEFTCAPSPGPTLSPTATPTSLPSTIPSEIPTVSPSFDPSKAPSTFPSITPSAVPSNKPSCIGVRNEFTTTDGDCSIYVGSELQRCSQDIDVTTNYYAQDVCVECGKCSDPLIANTSPPTLNPSAPTAEDTSPPSSLPSEEGNSKQDSSDETTNLPTPNKTSKATPNPSPNPTTSNPTITTPNPTSPKDFKGDFTLPESQDPKEIFTCQKIQSLIWNSNGGEKGCKHCYQFKANKYCVKTCKKYCDEKNGVNV